jgi:hypothetical protein
MARFEKGAERPMNAGRKLGSVNKTTPLLKDAILLAGCVAGDRLVEREIIERRARDAAENDSPESAGELKQAVEENGSLVATYRGWRSSTRPRTRRCSAASCRSRSESIAPRTACTAPLRRSSEKSGRACRGTCSSRC